MLTGAQLALLYGDQTRKNTVGNTGLSSWKGGRVGGLIGQAQRLKATIDQYHQDTADAKKADLKEYQDYDKKRRSENMKKYMLQRQRENKMLAQKREAQREKFRQMGIPDKDIDNMFKEMDQKQAKKQENFIKQMKNIDPQKEAMEKIKKSKPTFEEGLQIAKKAHSKHVDKVIDNAINQGAKWADPKDMVNRNGAPMTSGKISAGLSGNFNPKPKMTNPVPKPSVPSKPGYTAPTGKIKSPSGALPASSEEDNPIVKKLMK